MQKKLAIIFIVCFGFPQILLANINNQDIVSPIFLKATETNTIFQNPAELPLYDNVFGGQLSYDVNNQKLGGSVILHIPDMGLGDFGFSMELYSTNFLQNIVWIQDSSEMDDGHFALSQSNFKGLITWAKKIDLFTIGWNGKLYQYNDLNNIEEKQNALGMDLGIFITPVPDLYLGAVITDFGDTIIRDYSWNKEIKKVPQELRLSAALVSDKDMAFSIGIPFSQLLASKNDPNNAWKRASFQGRKVLGNFLVLGAGYNSRDIFYSLGFKLNDFFRITLTGSKDVWNLAPNDNMFIPNAYVLTFSYGLSFQSLSEISKSMSELSESQKEPINPMMDYPTNIMKRSFESPTHIRSNERKEIKLERKIESLENKIDHLEDQNYKKDKIEALKDKIESLKQSIETKNKKLDKLQDKYEDLKEEKDPDRFDVKEKILDLKDEIKDLEETLSSKKRELRNLED